MRLLESLEAGVYSSNRDLILQCKRFDISITAFFNSVWWYIKIKTKYLIIVEKYDIYIHIYDMIYKKLNVLEYKRRQEETFHD